MGAAIVLRRDLEIEVVDLSIDVSILDAGIGEMDLLIEVRQVVLARPLFDLLGLRVGPAVAVSIAAIPLLQEPLIVAFQLAIEFDANDACLAALEPFSGLQIGTIDLRVMRPFARLVGARIEGLALVGMAGLDGVRAARGRPGSM